MTHTTLIITFTSALGATRSVAPFAEAVPAVIGTHGLAATLTRMAERIRIRRGEPHVRLMEATVEIAESPEPAVLADLEHFLKQRMKRADHGPVGVEIDVAVPDPEQRA